jgi:hypothetical protein
MGSPPRRILAVAFAALAAAGLGAVSARAAAPDDARATAAAFLDAVIKDDAERACALLTPEAIARIGGPDRCLRTFGESESAQDFEAVETLARALAAARKSAAKHHGHYLTKHFTKQALARDIERRDPQLTVKLGRGPDAAAGQLVTTAVLDTRSTARRVVLYAESDDGSILRLSAAVAGDPSLEEVGFGIPETTQKPAGPTVTATVDDVTTVPDGSMLVHATFTVTDEDETESYPILLVVVQRGGRYLVDDVFYSALSDP